jgi:hypothetical protein
VTKFLLILGALTQSSVAFGRQIKAKELEHLDEAEASFLLKIFTFGLSIRLPRTVA